MRVTNLTLDIPLALVTPKADSGSRETFYSGAAERHIESFLVDFEGDLYGELDEIFLGATFDRSVDLTSSMS